MNAILKYEAALETARTAAREFRFAQTDYRSRKTGDAEYLAARAKWEASGVAFDAAEAAYRNATANEGDES